MIRLVLVLLVCAAMSGCISITFERFPIQVADEAGHPIADATVYGEWWFSSFRKPKTFEKRTDTNGCCKIWRRRYGRLEYVAQKPNYYTSYGEFYFEDKNHRSERIVLRKIRENKECLKPFPRTNTYSRYPAVDKWLPFDLEVADWLPPHGKGVHDDVRIRFNSEKSPAYGKGEVWMDISFTNSPHAGAYAICQDPRSEFPTPRRADPRAPYKTSYHYCNKWLPTMTDQYIYFTFPYALVFRTRVKVDAQGKMVSAHYGVIQGPWKPNGHIMELPDGCFNPTPNDTNIEDSRSIHHYFEKPSSD